MMNIPYTVLQGSSKIIAKYCLRNKIVMSQNGELLHFGINIGNHEYKGRILTIRLKSEWVTEHGIAPAHPQLSPFVKFGLTVTFWTAILTCSTLGVAGIWFFFVDSPPYMSNQAWFLVGGAASCLGGVIIIVTSKLQSVFQ